MANILIVEDQRDIAEGLSSLLATEGHRVSHVPNGEAALQKLRQGVVPDLLLLDLATPVVDGYEFRRRQLADPSIAHVPVIVLTATTHVRDPQTLKAHAILTKPVDFDVLCEAIDKACLSAGAVSSS